MENDGTERCGNCKFRGNSITKINTVSKPSGYFVCTKMELGQKLKNKPLAYVQDGSDYYAALCVANDFACNCWEKIE